ncbi:MAG TPA: cytochrome c peroxidase [Bryobacteraceae bacterium]|nr:cytochrome c peroxidase [Bryobacteraceae bacterium]
MKRLVLAWMAALPACAGVLTVPLGLDAYLPVPETNPLTPAKIALGKKLFFDKALSQDGSMACASCHQPEHAFTDQRQVAMGIGGQAGTRRVPRLANRVYGKSFFWDGRAASLEEQVLQPIANAREMGSSDAEAARRVGITVPEMRDALASFVRTILSGGARYDHYLAGEDGALTAQEKLGLRLFTGKADCSSCHVGPNLTDERFHNTGVGNGDDPGRAAVTGREEDRGAFKTPGLRDVARTPPYMHDGSLATLNDVIDFYNKGGHSNPQLDSEIRPLHLTAEEEAALVAFLEALNGQVRSGD